MSDESFTKQMRKATREIHAISDALVNAKLFFALSDNSVWGEGLLIFYEIFRFLEESMKECQGSNLSQLLLDGLERTNAFEQDLAFYLGSDWSKDYEVRESVAEYLLHLKTLRKEDPDLLLAYVYHLYMGLLSGGQILSRKRQLKGKILRIEAASGGYAITDFGDASISSLKRTMKERMDEIASTLSDEEKDRLLLESKKVFEWNNKIIKTVKGTTRIIMEKSLWLLSVIFIVYLILHFFTLVI